MLAITLYQPWASYVADGTKPIENRPWAPRPQRCPPGTYIAVHAGLTWDAQGAEKLASILEMLGLSPLGPRSEYPQGAIVGVARFDGVVRAAPPSDIADPAWFFGPVGWLLRDACAIRPVPCAGSRGLWPIPQDVAARVKDEWREAMRRQFRVPLRSPEKLAAVRDQARETYPPDVPVPDHYTCDHCPLAPGCRAVFHSYSVNGDCILEK